MSVRQLVSSHAVIGLILVCCTNGCGGSPGPLPGAQIDEGPVPGLKVIVSGFKNTDGQLRYAVFSSKEGFPEKESAMYRGEAPVGPGAVEVKLKKLPAGPIAVVVFHDRNQNGELDTNFLGIPRESFGFSRNPPVRFGAPEFHDCAVLVHPEQSESLRISLQHM